jgi:hypothetical protein
MQKTRRAQALGRPRATPFNEYENQFQCYYDIVSLPLVNQSSVHPMRVFGAEQIW